VGEVELASLLCAFLAGSEAETRGYFDANGLSRYVRVDCETDSHVIEVGMDNTSSARDSIHQAIFFEHLTGKTPMVIIIDTDGFEGRYEYEIRIVAERLGIAFATCSEGWIIRWAQTSPWREIGLDKTLDDLPMQAAVRSQCDITF